MPLFYTQTIDDFTRLAVWQIAEPEAFFLEKVPVSRQITHPHKRLQHLAGRYLLQWLFPDFPIHLIQVADTRKPFLASESHHFSISHCGDFAAAIVSTGRRVGVDIELHTERIKAISHKFLNEQERELPQSSLEIFPTLIWSAKEAMYKWYSLGGIDFQHHLQVSEIFDVSASEGIIQACFKKEYNIPLELRYRIWDKLVLTWTG